MKVLIISQPKSGTYLCANLLQEFGLKFDGYHFSETYYYKYDLSNKIDCLRNYKQYKVYKNIFESINYIKDNSFGVSHFNYKEELEPIFKDFKKIIITRDADRILESFDRFTSMRPTSPDTVLDVSTLNQLEWIKTPNTFHLTFSDMINKNVNALNNLQAFLFCNILYDSYSSISNALYNDSLTKSNLR